MVEIVPNSAVVNPSHYNTNKKLVFQNPNVGLQVIDVINHFGLDFPLGNALKYLLRAGKKNPSDPIEDLEKALFYIQEKIRLIKWF